MQRHAELSREYLTLKQRPLRQTTVRYHVVLFNAKQNTIAYSFHCRAPRESKEII